MERVTSTGSQNFPSFSYLICDALHLEFREEAFAVFLGHLGPDRDLAELRRVLVEPDRPGILVEPEGHAPELGLEFFRFRGRLDHEKALVHGGIELAVLEHALDDRA